MNRTLRLAAIGIGIVIFIAVLMVIVARSNDRNELARYKAELRARGEKLTIEELGPPLATNASQVAARARFSSNTFVLGIEPGAMRFVGAGQTQVAWEGSNYISQTSKTRITNSFENIGSRLSAHESQLKVILDLLKEPWPDTGQPLSIYMNRPFPIDFVQLRGVAQGLSVATTYHLHQRDLEKSLESLHGLISMGNLYKNERILVAHMVRVAIAGLGLAATWEALQAPGWNEKQLEALQKHWEQVDLSDAVERGFSGERAFSDMHIQQIKANTVAARKALGKSASVSLKDTLVIEPFQRMTISGNELYLLREHQFILETVRSIDHTPWIDVKTAMDKRMIKFDKETSGNVAKLRYWFVLMALPNFQRALQHSIKSETQRQMTIAAIAIKRYELRHGKAPTSLEALVPDFLESLPHDFMSAKPLRYRLNVDGSHVLYSVGEDGKDDGGDANPPKPVTIFDLWSGRDAVWPLAVTNDSAVLK